MEHKQKNPISNKIIVTLYIVLGIVVIVLLLMYLAFHTYVNKMTIVTTKQDHVAIESEPEPKNEDSYVPDSPQNEIISIEDRIRKNMEDKSTPIIYDKDVFNILLIGNDSREVNCTGRSDAIIIISFHKKNKTITATSLLRDIYLQIPGKNNNRINAAYAFGGPNLLMDTIEENFKIRVDRYASVGFYDFMGVVDSVGGVMLEVTEEEIPVINSYVKEINGLTGHTEEKDCLSSPGLQLLDGKQALGYARNRYIGNNDFERTARARRVLEQIFMNVKESNLLELNDLLNNLLPQITTNLTEGEIFSLILSLTAYKDYTVEQYSIPKEGTYSFMKIRGMSVLGIDFEENIREIHNNIYGEN